MINGLFTIKRTHQQKMYVMWGLYCWWLILKPYFCLILFYISLVPLCLSLFFKHWWWSRIDSILISLFYCTFFTFIILLWIYGIFFIIFYYFLPSSSTTLTQHQKNRINTHRNLVLKAIRRIWTEFDFF